MYVSWRWIQELVPQAQADPEQLALRFTLSVAEIEGVTTFGGGLEGVLVARVIDVQPHPDADKLRLATCDVAGETVTVVCGAPDLELGGVYPFAPPGVDLPSGIQVREGEIRGVRSPGMLCSERDLGLSDEHGGLLRLDGVDPAAGESFCEAVGLPDTLWEIDNKSITHRPDLWGMHGIAREVAALLQVRLPALGTDGLTLGERPPVQLRVEESSHCSRYLCARIDGVAVGPSPVRDRLRLRSLGVRPISNVVDATNLVMLETGNPLHAFDARFVRGGQIVVRQAREGEVLRTLDGLDRALTAQDCVIADAEGAVALAGVMGGEDSEIRDDTTAVILEAASFDGAAIRKTATRLGMRTESSARFEKHLDEHLSELAARRFLVTLQRLSPGCAVTSALADEGAFVQRARPSRSIPTSSGYLRSRLGVTEQEAPDAWLDRTLAALGFTVHREGDAMVVKVPSFRAGRDVGIAEDLVEEVGRIYGYDHVRSATPLVPSRRPILPATKRQERDVRAVCTLERGLREVMLYSFDDEPLRDRLGLAELGSDGAQSPRLALRNYLSSENTHLRRQLASNVLGALQANLARGTLHDSSRKGLRVGVYEIGRVFLPERGHVDAQGRADLGAPEVALGAGEAREAFTGRMDEALRAGTEAAATFAQGSPLPAQPRHLCIAIGERLGGGALGADDVIVPDATLSKSLYRELIGGVEAVVARLGRGAPRVARGVGSSGCTWIHPARGGVITIDGAAVGHAALLHPRIRGRLDVPAEVAIAELDLDALLALPARSLRAAAPAKFPATTFDLTLQVPRGTRAGSVGEVLLSAGQRAAGDVVRSVALIADYDGEQGRALTYRITCRDEERTLKDKEVLRVRAAIEAAAP